MLRFHRLISHQNSSIISDLGWSSAWLFLCLIGFFARIYYFLKYKNE